MGLDVSHGCWSGPYSRFMKWRRRLARAAGLPPLDLMEGFYDPAELVGLSSQIASCLPIRWDCLGPDPIIGLLNHSDSDGIIPYESLRALADRLLALLPEMEHRQMGEEDWTEETRQFITGLLTAFERGEDVEFH